MQALKQTMYSELDKLRRDNDSEMAKPIRKLIDKLLLLL